MIIAIPSKGRSELTTSDKVLKNAVFYVPENEHKEYSNNIKNKIIQVPLKVKGITATRNYILKQNHNEDVLFIDDDVRECGYFKETERVSLLNDKYSELWENVFKKMFDVCKGYNFKIYGVEVGGSKFANHPLNPISFKSIINASCMGIVNDGSYYFDENFEVKEDYDIMLRHYKDKGGVLKFRNVYWRTYHWENKGGCVDYRTDEIEDKCINQLKERFPMMIKTGMRKNKHQIQIKWV